MLLSPQRISEIFAEANAIITGDHFVYAKKADGWYHGPAYVNKDAIYLYPWCVRELCSAIASHFIGRDYGIEVVVGPTVGGVGLSQWTTYWLSCHEGRTLHEGKVLAVCADEEDVFEQREHSIHPALFVAPFPQNTISEFDAFGKVKIEKDSLGDIKIVYLQKFGTRRVIKRGYDKHVKGMRCLIVEDVINSGATVVKTRDAVLAAGGEVVGVGCLCNRSGGKVTAQTLGVPELFSLLDVNMKMFPEDECPICKERGPESVRTDIGKGKEFLARKGLA